MAKRDIFKTAAAANPPANYCLMVEEWKLLSEMAQKSDEGRFNAILTAFNYGFVLGTRANQKIHTKN